MTTIVYDGKTIACDSRVSGNYTFDRIKKLHRVGNLVFGTCGRVSSAMAFIEWAKDRTKAKPKIDDDFEVLEVHPSGKVYSYDHNFTKCPEVAPCAIGSGSPFAMAAILCGKDAIGAVKVAIKLDQNSGGKVQSIKIK